MATPDSVPPIPPEISPPPPIDVPTKGPEVPDGPDVEEVPPDVLPGQDVDPPSILPRP